VDRHGSVHWWCAPRFDSPSVFARILDAEAGHFTISPQRLLSVTREYEDGSLVLRTIFETETGRARFRDALLMADGVRGHDLGVDSPHMLARHVECLEGAVDLEVDFSPRFEYGLTHPLVDREGDVLFARGGATTLVLSTSAAMEVRDGYTATGHVHLEATEQVGFAISAVSTWKPLSEYWDDQRIRQRIDDTVEAWRTWGSEHQRYEGPFRHLVEHSGRVLQALTYQPTGAMVAAPTTSLPEEVGGERNWDYRYCWIRDAGFTLRALWVAACPDEAGLYLDYITAAASSVFHRNEIQIMFGIGGERDLSERTLPWLGGWRESAPVRVGNAAWTQTQHDVYGDLLLSVLFLREQFGELTDIQRRLLVFLADTACAVWQKPDHGLWEIRREPRHYVHSKLMCWVAIDRAVTLADDLGAGNKVETWKREREKVKTAILEEGWSDSAQSFTQSFGSDDLDAAALVIPMVGLLPYDDSRVVATVNAVKDRLVDRNGLVNRYRKNDGLGGDEGAFLLCTFWLVEALAGLGETEQAREIFEKTVAYANDLGLMSEEVDGATGTMLGNFPQAFSHVGLINAAWAISESQRDKTSTPGVAPHRRSRAALDGELGPSDPVAGDDLKMEPGQSTDEPAVT
jgi:GH15 family glucan-1,4-alpha-glucosidase